MKFKHGPFYSYEGKNYGQTLFISLKRFLNVSLAATTLIVLFICSRSFATTPSVPDVWLVDAGEDQNICLGDTAQLAASGANSYQWFPATGLSCADCPNPMASPDITTMYVVMGDDGSMDSVLVSVFTLPQIISIIKMDPTDCNLANGIIVIEAVNTGGSLQYSIDGGANWQNNNTFTAVAAGTYNIVVRNPDGACGLVQGENVNLQTPPVPQILNVLANNPTLCDVPNGSIVISSAGGVSPLQYSIDGGLTWQNQNTFQLLGSGIYDIVVSNANGSCQVSGGTVTLTGSPNEAFISEIVKFPPSACDASDGLITIILNNDDGGFEFSINGGLNYQSSNSFPNLDEGIFHIVVRRTDGTCITSGGFVSLSSVSRPTILGESILQPQGCGTNNGLINILAFGISTLEFSIDGGVTWQASNDFENLTPGVYKIAVRNNDGTCFTTGETVTLTAPNQPVISGVSFTNPSACGMNDGKITVAAAGANPLEYSIDGGATWSAQSNFTGLGEAIYSVVVRYNDGNCAVSYPLNPISLDAPGAPPAIIQVKTTDPGPCLTNNGTITIEASGTGQLCFSINGGTSFQPGNSFSGLSAGVYQVVVKLAGGSCSTTASTTLVAPASCLDTVQVTIQGNNPSTICLDPVVFDYQGNLTGAGFCGQGNASTVVATSINQACVTLMPASGFAGLSPNLICVVHCFDNSALLCDTTYIQVTIQNPVNCDDIFSEENVVVLFTGNPTAYCVPLAPFQASAYSLTLDGLALGTLQGCDFDSVIVYTYAFLPGGGFTGPYTLDSWTINGVTYTGFFGNANELLLLMNALDPNGNWQISSTNGIIFGGDIAKTYGDMQITHLPSGTKSVMTTNFSIIPNGFIVNLNSPDEHVLVATDPAQGCSDTLVINSNIVFPETETIFLTTTVNTPTTTVCVNGSEMPTGMIQNLGYCVFPANGSAPIVNDSCVFYVPGQNFIGTDTFCVSVCDNSFPFQVCDSTIFIVNVLPKTDTVFLTIPGNVTTLDTCFNTAIIELPGVITLSTFCALELTELSANIDQECLSFSPANNFTGVSQVCVAHCSGNVCDTTIILVTVEPPIVCDEVFLDETVSIPSLGSNGAFCIPISTGDIVGYDVFIDGGLFTQSFVPCGMSQSISYDYGTLPAGPYFLEGWTVNGNLFFGLITSVDVLVDSMNVWDPSGNWVNNLTSQVIIGMATGATYGNLVISQIGGSTFTLSPASISQPAGSQIPISGFGAHEVVVMAANGCSDTVTVVLEKIQISTDTVQLTTYLNTPLTQICANTGELLGTLFSVSFCAVPANAGIAFQHDTCVNYNPTFGFLGSDAFCIVLCDDSQPAVCDTFFYLVQVLPPVDTVFIDAAGVDPFDTCLDSTVIQLPGSIATAQVCAANASEVSISVNNTCATIDPVNGFTGTSIACVVHCDDSNPAICDTTILIINVDGGVSCSQLFNPDQVTVSTQNGNGEVCLPISPTDILAYDVFLDGSPYAGPFVGCNFDSAYIYFYGLVVGQGNTGPYSINWQANGNTFTATVANVQALVDSMNVWDPFGNWMLEPSLFIMLSSFDNGVYGTLSITHVPTGSISNLGADFNGIPAGTLINFSGLGEHEIVLVNPADGCSDTLSVNAVDVADVIQITTFEDVPSTVVCIDITGLPGTFTTMSVCNQPEFGMFIINSNCFTYNPGPGYIGNDDGCLVVCDDLGNCDTTFVLITVEPLCSLFDFFPSDTQSIALDVCNDLATWCVPYQLDSMVNFGVLDNGFPYTGGFQPCNLVNAQIQFDTGFHEIVFIHLNTGCTDTLRVNVTCQPDTTGGCGVSALSPAVLFIGDCAGQAEFCVSAALSTVSQFFVVTDNGALATVQPCAQNNQLAAVLLSPGTHEVVFSDTVKGCADTFHVEVNCGLLPDVSIDTVVEVNDTLVICLDDLGFDPSEIDSLVNECQPLSMGNGTFLVDANAWCLSLIGQNIGEDTACFKVYLGDTSAQVFVHVTVIEPCPDLLPDSLASGVTSCTLNAGLLCLPINLVQAENLVVEVNGLPYPDAFVPCNFDSIYVLNYSQLPSMGLIPPYVIENWSIDGTVFTGVFSSAQVLADSMNLWDPAGNWQVVNEPVSGSTLIVGGVSSNTYGPMLVEQQLSGIQVSLGLNATYVPLGVGIVLPIGSFSVSVRDTATLCEEVFIATLTCLSSDLVTDTILVGASDTLCLDLSELLGAAVNVTNICPGSNGEVVNFIIQDTCVIYTGLEPGQDSACIVACDDLGVCDTTYLFVIVEVKPDTNIVAVDDTILTGEGEVVLIQVLGNDTIISLTDFFLLDLPVHGSALFLPNGEVNYVPSDGYCDDAVPDSFTYVICSLTLCDTATVYVTVQCTSLQIFNGFSPNGDGINDFFKITGLANFPNHVLRVYNRWGNIVLEATDYQSDWDGTWEGKLLPDGTYFYMLELGDGEKIRKGYVQLHR